jgi:hypothetical protein
MNLKVIRNVKDPSVVKQYLVRISEKVFILYPVKRD